MLAILLSWPAEKPEAPTPEPEVAMVFESGNKALPLATHPGPKKPTPPAEPATPARPPQAAPPAPKPILAPPPPRPVPPPPPAPSTPPSVRLPAPEPLPPPLALPPDLAPLPTPAAPPRPAPPARQASRQAGPPRAAFPRPTFRSWTLGQPAPSAESKLLETRTPSERVAAATALRQAAGGSVNYDVKGAENLGPDWMNAFSAWVEAHLFYPPKAAENNEDGTNQVSIRVTRDGHIAYNDVDLEMRSGSIWLDLGTQGLFRDAHLPPFPPDALDKELTIQVTIHYIIVR